ncbi:MAG TPA: hypothetical protein VH475_13155 [Tepidisphaeraceae bacterium]|jgi:hypothetical protein
MASFGGVTFAVMGESGQLPTIERDTDGTPRFRASIRLASLSDRNALANLISVVTVLPCYGRLGSNCHIAAGAGAATLVMPAAAGSTISRQAVLVSLATIRADAHDARQRFTAAAEWVLLS